MIDYNAPTDASVQQPAYVITRVEDTFGATSLGNQQRYKRVYFKPLGQAETYVDVPLTPTVVQDAEAAIMAHVQQVAGILSLQAPTI